MYNKHTLTLYAAVISSMVVASVFAISFVQEQHALAQGSKTASSSSSNHTAAGGNKTSGAAGSNRAGGNATGGGTATNATY